MIKVKKGFVQGSHKGYDLVGQEFGLLTVIKDTGKRNPKRGKIWFCRCKCGEYTKVPTNYLTRGSRGSCGCSLREEDKKEKRKNKKTRKVSTKKKEKRKNKRTRKNSAKKKNEFKIPSELQNVPYRIVQDGLLQVFKNERIFRHTSKGLSECKVTSSNGYKVVTATKGGNQSNYYVHRLLAEAFIPNPDNKPLVIFKDNDRTNTCFDNLMWATDSDRARILYESGKTNPYKNAFICKECSGYTWNEFEFCAKCNDKKTIKDNQKRIIQERIESVSDIRLDLITPKQREAVEMTLKGKSLVEAADALGITRQGVDSLIKNARIRSKRVEAKIKSRKDEAANKKIVIKDSNDIKVLRILHDFNLKDMGDYLGITSNAYRQKEIDPSRFKVMEAIKVAKLFNKTVEDLFDSIEEEIV